MVRPEQNHGNSTSTINYSTTNAIYIVKHTLKADFPIFVRIANFLTNFTNSLGSKYRVQSPSVATRLAEITGSTLWNHQRHALGKFCHLSWGYYDPRESL
jgi:ABC-type dipeptide/oligopeptide/nickel transport system permease component